MLARLALVAFGGGLGSAARYLTSLPAARLFGAAFPLGTLAVNLAGCLLIGVAFGLAERALVGPSARLLLMTGFLGGFTTFSTFALESVTLYQDGAGDLTLINLAASTLGGLLLVLAGLALARLL